MSKDGTRPDDLLVRREELPERERERRRPALLEVGEPLLRLVDRRDVSGRHPPQGRDGSLELLEPVAPLPEDSGVVAAENEAPEVLDRLPDREVDDDPLV